jgi:hypothetical protein
LGSTARTTASRGNETRLAAVTQARISLIGLP